MNPCISMQTEPFPRPQTVIKIINIPDASESNPEPEPEAEKSFGEFISPQKLKYVGGVSNLFDLIELKIKVDTSETSIGHIGSMAPNLKSLNLSNSFVTSIRDLGTNLNNLNTLWLSRCCLAELDGISCINALKELYLAYNEIFDLSPLSMLENLEVLDLEGNNIDDITQVEFLSLCAQLNVLTLKGNPLEHSPSPMTNPKDLKFYSYGDAILSCLPQLKMLDDHLLLVELINGQEVKRINPNNASRTCDDMMIIQDSLKSLEQEPLNESVDGDTGTCRPSTAHRRCESAKPTSIIGDKIDHTMENSLFESADCSNLTNGQVMCGNPVSALRRRNKKKKHTITHERIQQRINGFVAEHSYLEDNLDNKDDIFEALKQWQLSNKHLFEDNSTCSSLQDRSNPHPSYSDSNISKTKLSPEPAFSPTPPSKARTNKPSPHIRRSLPSPPASSINESRPHTASDFRSRYYRLQSPDIEHFSSASPLKCINENRTTSCGGTSLSINNNTVGNQPERPGTARAAMQSITKPRNGLLNK